MKLFTIIISFLILSLSLFANKIMPFYTYKANSGVTDIIYNNDKIYVSTTASSIDIFDTLKKEKIDSILIPKIKDFMGEEVDSKIYSLDLLNDNILILSQGNKGARNISIFRNNTLQNVISDKNNLFIAKAKFIDENTIIFALLSNEIFVYDLVTKRILQKKQISHSKFSNFVLSENKKLLVVADESGNLKMLDSKSLKVIKKFENQNLDNVFQVDLKNDIIITAGQDRKSVLYNIKNQNVKIKKAPFIIYSTGLSPSAKLAAISINENNDVLIFESNYMEEKYILIGNPAIITNILFINEKEIFITSDHEQINYYKIN